MLYTDRYAAAQCFAVGSQLSGVHSVTALCLGDGSGITVILVPDIFFSTKYVV